MLPDRVKQKLRELPDKPGCYRMRDARGTIIYVGKAASLRKRVQSYFREATLRSAPPKLRSLIHSVADLDWIEVRSEAEALLTEGKLIKDYRPRYNVDFRDDKRFLLIRMNVQEPLPQLKAVRLQKNDGAQYFGPYASSAAARAAIEFAERRFGLRRCRPRVPGAEEHRHCINDIVRFCAAPCIGKVSADEYRQRAATAAEFLRGERPEYLAELRAAMETAAQALDFEKAAAVRDSLRLLAEATRRRVRISGTPAVAQATAETGLRELQTAFGLARPPQVIEGFDISNISGTLAVASMVCAEGGIPQTHRYRRFRIRTVSGSDDPAMMAEVIRRRYGRLKDEGRPMPDLILVDGGVPQLHAARTELQRLGLEGIAVAALAKRFEEIYIGTGKAPVPLATDSAAVKVLQRLRDEAHRFALAYHQRLRAKLIRESRLDDIHGLGAKRKAALLRHFGSMERLSQAGVEEIAAQRGVGRAMAETIVAYLRPE